LMNWKGFAGKNLW